VTTARPTTLGALLFLASAAVALAGPALSHKALLDVYAAASKAADSTFAGFSAQRGEALFRRHFTTGRPDTRSCTVCHTEDPKKLGQTRAGKDIEPMAASVTPDRYTDHDKTEKWFGRNCRNVLGRDCTPQEKGDFISFMLTQ
jgi:Domain of unknown function (DUF1924)